MDRHWESSLHQHRHRTGARGEGGYTLYCGFRVLVSLFSCLTLPDQQKLRVKSPVLKKQACPQWKHSFVFNGVSSSQLRQSTLELTVWDQAIFGMNDRLLGEARLGSSKSVQFLWVCLRFSEKAQVDALSDCPTWTPISKVETIQLALKLPCPVLMGIPKPRSNSARG